jgi:hypothetical protein
MDGCWLVAQLFPAQRHPFFIFGSKTRNSWLIIAIHLPAKAWENSCSKRF